MSFEKLAEQYYTAREARVRLGLTSDAFQNWVKTGKLTKLRLPGMGQGFFLKRDIDRKAQLVEAALFLETTQLLELKAATPAEVDAEIHLAHLIYGKRALAPEAQRARKRLVEFNHESTWHLYDRDVLAASISMAPFTHAAIEAFQHDKHEWLFDYESIKPFASGEALECILLDVMTTPTVPPEKRTFYAEVLLRAFATIPLRDLGARGVELSKVYTYGNTDAGRALLRKSGVFKEVDEPVPGRIIFEMDVEITDFILLRPYRDALAAWKALHHESTPTS